MEFTQTLLNMLCMTLYCGRPCAADSKQRGAATMHLKPPLPPPHHGQLCAVAELQLHAPPAAARAACSCARRLQLRAQAACSCPQSSKGVGQDWPGIGPDHGAASWAAAGHHWGRQEGGRGDEMRGMGGRGRQGACHTRRRRRRLQGMLC